MFILSLNCGNIIFYGTCCSLYQWKYGETADCGISNVNFMMVIRYFFPFLLNAMSLQDEVDYDFSQISFYVLKSYNGLHLEATVSFILLQV